MLEAAYAWSIVLRPIRNSLPNVVLSWFRGKYSLPVHTFVTVGDSWHAPPQSDSAHTFYWYCAGDFCPTDQQGINRSFLGDIDPYHTSCFVKPNIMQSDPRHELEVIGGKYGVDFVCHNITNRILHSAPTPMTLADTNLPLTGYKLIINSPLGVYGRNKREWMLTIGNCKGPIVSPGSSGGSAASGLELLEQYATSTPPVPKLMTAGEETVKIHKRAVKGNLRETIQVTKSLKELDTSYRDLSSFVFDQFLMKKINAVTFDREMSELAEMVMFDTQRIVGKDLAMAILGKYDLSDEKKKVKIEGATRMGR